jgi:AcrR family transcriptional regulator
MTTNTALEATATEALGHNATAAAYRQRDRIRLAAVQLFTRQSYAGTSMKQLAQDLGMTPANLYNYYASKEAILFEVLSHELTSLLERSHAIVAAYDDPAQRIRELARDLVFEDLQNPRAAFVGRHGTNGLTEDGRNVIAGLMAEVRTIWAAAVDEGAKRGVFEVDDPHLSTLSVLTLCSSTSSWYSSSGDVSPEDVADHIAEAVLRILGAPRTPVSSTIRGNGEGAPRGRRQPRAAGKRQSKTT